VAYSGGGEVERRVRRGTTAVASEGVPRVTL
jgi:hypothetical protein